MRKTLLFTALLASITPSIAETKTTVSMPESVMQNIIERDVALANQAVQTLKAAIQSNTTDKRTDDIDKAFTGLVRAWKAVQTAYVAGEIDIEVIDTPKLIDTFHSGKENLVEKLTHIVKKGEAPKLVLFKNTFKSINALSFFLYENDEISETERDYALYTLNALGKHFQAIEKSYKDHEADFNKDSDMSMSFLLNALIDSSYKLKEWRVGDPAGFSRKYKGEPKAARQEYPYSQKSWDAIAAILVVHDDMMSARDYPNLGSTAIAQGAKTEVENIRKLIATAKQQTKALTNNKTSLSDSDAVEPLFTTLTDLNDAYYQSLVKALPVQEKILDADGD